MLNLDANAVFHMQRNIMSGGGPRYDPRYPVDYGSAEKRYTRQADAVGMTGQIFQFVLGMPSRFPLLDITSQLSRTGKARGPWYGVTPMGITRNPVQLTSTKLAKVSS